MRKKSAVALLLALLLLMTPAAGSPFKNEAAAQSEIRIDVRGTTLALSAPAFLERGTTIVPLREIAVALGAEVGYQTGSDGKQTVTLQREGRSAALTVGSPNMTANGKSNRLEASARLVGDVTMVPLRALSEALGAIVAWDGPKRIVTIDDPAELPAIGSAGKLRELMESASLTLRGYSMKYGVDSVQESVAASAAADRGASTESAPSSEGGSDYSQTNVQVEGVDEADWAKTDGRFIYQLSGSRVLITNIADPAKPALAAKLEYDNEDGFYPQELYVDNKRLIVIGQQNVNLPYDTPASGGGDQSVSSGAAISEGSIEAAPRSEKKIGIWMPVPTRTTVKTLVYELADSGEPTLTRETEQEGSYISSRKIGSALYIVTNKYNHSYSLYIKEGIEADGEELVRSFEPVYRDSAQSNKLQSLPLDTIRYFPESPDTSMMLVGALDLDDAGQPLQVSGYLGSGQTIYASEKHLYVTIPKYVKNGDIYQQETQIHKFRLDQGSIVYIGAGSVPGSLLNQFSMDEHNGYFRIAATKGDMWASGEAGSTNNLYVLDEKLHTIGKLEGLAPGERIYSVRFMGSRAYMVTFRNVDPLFAIDLRNPSQPSVLGQLKIPGYSDYLHPYDENHIIGFGKETVELPSKGMSPDDTMAFYQGLKIALFDVTDVSQPKEKFKVVIGDRGTHSELLSDHKALLFSKEKGLLAFPVQLHEIQNKEKLESDSFPAYGDFTYQGAYVYRIDLQEGFKLQNRITHLTADELAKSGQYGYNYTKSIRRILYAGDTLYTLSDAMLKANDLASLEERGSLAYPAQPQEASVYPDGPQVLPLR
ncbi:beta-propeller domain-containing protein [Paenibacillus alkaliterrae]|uniref:beta-propeller domain-containing protein n=1 Tax=Paenibacillus alkaliterrae TaxID=320909 RepID=UPI001F33DF82|nr:beta-propeller domain-containing protein [Paenibacillus alkaliterrae]MCF2939254.1 beta-propeller domain-containing protein [Paenibacillus alkaliterrae]